MKYAIAFAILAAAAASAAVAQRARPVVLGAGGPDVDACSTAEVTGLNPRGDNFLSVRAAPNLRARALDRLGPRQQVFICDGTTDDAWVGIIYTRDPDQDCGGGGPVAHPSLYAGPCRSGWVSSRYVRVVAG